MPIRILLIDDHALVREGLRLILGVEKMDVVGEASDGEEGVRLARELQPDVAVIDLSMPRMNGFDTGSEILRVSPSTITILLTMHAEVQFLLQALAAGFRGCVLKSNAASELIRAIRHLAEGGSRYLSAGVSMAVVDAYLEGKESTPDPLTVRERQVLRLIADGRSTKEVAAALGLSVKTAECHRSHIMEKLDIHETASLVRYAIRRQLVTP